MRISILLASHSKLAGGMEKQVAAQAEHLNKLKELDITVIASPKLAYLFVDDIKFVPVAMDKSRRNPILLCSIYKALKNSNADIIHAHGHKAANILATLKSLLPSRSKLVATSHGIKKNNKSLEKMDAIITVSQSMQSHLSPIESQCIPNGVSTFESNNAFEKKDLCRLFSLNENLPIIIAVGRLAPVKRYDLLIEACHNLPVNLLIVGDGPESDQLKSIAASNTHFTGHRDDARKLMTAADLLVISSEREGFSLTLIEALLAKLPVLSSKVPGSVDTLPNQALFQSLDSISLRDKILETLQHYESYQACLEPVFEMAARELTLEANIRKTQSFYDELSRLKSQD